MGIANDVAGGDPDVVEEHRGGLATAEREELERLTDGPSRLVRFDQERADAVARSASKDQNVAGLAKEMNSFCPERIQSWPFGRAVVSSCLGSDPVCGSVNAHAAGASPRTRAGTQRAI